MDIRVVTKPSFAVIGKLGQGPSNSGPQWIKPLWDEANGRFSEISHLVKCDEDGKPVGIWGIMSDVSERFQRWDSDQGKYLAGCEANDDAMPPPGWTLWRVPSQTYIVAQCFGDTYQTVMSHVLKQYMPGNGYELIGAIHENFPQNLEKGAIELYFPIAKA
jgi:predicted transcriptional regulator YdeE